MSFNQNIFLAWLWILIGFVTGTVLGMFFHGENWLGGYGSFKRRMYRLGHISFFGLGAINLLFWLTMKFILPREPLADAASWAFVIGAITMPACCLVMAHLPKAQMMFAVPVVSLITGGALTLFLVQTTESQSPRAPNPQPSQLRSPATLPGATIASAVWANGSLLNRP